MGNGEHGERLARVEQRDEDILRRLASIETKVDQLTWKVAGFAGTVSLVTSGTVAVLLGTV